MRRLTGLLAIPALLLVLALPSGGQAGAAGAESGRAVQPCGAVTVPDGRPYLVNVLRVKCVKAKRWIIQVFNSPGHNWEPPGYKCYVLPNSKGAGGSCHVSREKYFAWYTVD